MKFTPRFIWRVAFVALLVGLNLSACQDAQPEATGGDQQGQSPTGESVGPPNPAGSTPTTAPIPPVSSEPSPTQVFDYAGWGEYANPQYGFSFRYPPGWSLEEIQEADNTMSGHLVRLKTQSGKDADVEMLIGFKRLGEDQLIWPTGVGEGEFVPKGAVSFIGQEVKRNVLVCQDLDMKVYYQQEGGIQRGDLEFSLILSYPGSCLDQFSIPDEIQAIADNIVSSFQLDE